MNKKTLNLLAVCIVVLVIAFIYAKKNAPVEKEVFSDNITVDGSTQGAGGDFSDSDSYQQDLLQTIAQQNIAAFEKVANSFKKSSTDSLSETIAKDVFSQYLQYNTSGDLDVEKLQNLTADTLKNQVPDVKLTQYQQLIIVPSTIYNLEMYTIQISQIQHVLNKKLISVSEYPNQVPYIKAIYATEAKLFAELPVPEELAKYHLQVINGFESYVEGFKLLELQQTDPAKALFGVQIAQKGNNSVIEGVANIKRIINLNNIVYNKEDIAYAWLLDVAAAEKIKTQ